MTEGRHCQVHLLDNRTLELLVQPKLLSRELLDLVASHFNLKEKEYFGITFTDDTGQCIWLQLENRVLEHDLPKTSGPVALYFAVKFYIENIAFLKDNATVELFFLNAKSCIDKGTLEVDSQKAFTLAAYVIQESKGDYTSDETVRIDLKKIPALPTKALQEHPSLAYCEERVIECYKNLTGLTRGQAIVQYMTIVEALPTYGVHYYKVKDKQGLPWWLGISYRGIGQYDLQDKIKPRKFYQWKQLENLYFREKKFAVEVNDPRRVSVSRRTFGPSGLAVHTWYASPSLIKSIWLMAISQHQFYLDRKQSKAKIPSARSLGDIAMDLTELGTPKPVILPAVGTKNQLIMASNGSLISSGSQEEYEISEEQRKEKLAKLKKKEAALQELLAQKLEELKQICLREAELTGKVPKEYPLGDREKLPQIRRRIGTTFKLDDSLLESEEDPQLQSLENSFAIQQKLVEAAKKLLSEPDLCKNVKKKRKHDYADAVRKLREIENSINEYRMQGGRTPVQRGSPIPSDDLIPSESSSLSDTFLDEDDSHGKQRQRSATIQQSPRPHPPQFLKIEQHHRRRASAGEQITDREQLRYGNSSYKEPLSAQPSPFKTQERQSPVGRSMPTTPVLTRNAYSSSYIWMNVRNEQQHCRQRSGSFESQTQLLPDTPSDKPVFTISDIKRSSSTEVLDDRSSCTSQSSSEYYSTVSKPAQWYSTRTVDRANRRRHKKQNFSASNSGSMPNLAQKDLRNGIYQNAQNCPVSSYYVSGCTSYTDSDRYSNGGYVYENDTEGHYSVNPSYNSSPYCGYDGYRDFYRDELDTLPQHPYATIRPSRKAGSKVENITKNIQKALVAEHLRGWYQRAASHKDLSRSLQADFDLHRGSQNSLSLSGFQVQLSPTSRTTSYGSVCSSTSAANRRSQPAAVSVDYCMPAQQYSNYYENCSSTPVHSRSHMEQFYVESTDESQLEDSFQDSEQQLLWHEDSKPGTLV
ncbi:FERM domain-containing protein 4B isoform X2 [Protopterus annectens]|nr:FERM domain-containing protein 4B isoform X2 [Protopterus annectens]